jgi:hypothetical protein
MSPKPFLAVDGEACEGDYVLMCRSGSAPLTDLGSDGGLHSVACLEFLLRAPKPCIQVCFGLGYDVNNWLRDLPRRILIELWVHKVTYWRDYRLEWIPSKWFAVKCTDGRSAKICEVFGFFQSKFVNALEAWGIGAPAEIARMKSERGTFKRAEIAAVTRYCERECSLLVELMDQLRDAARVGKVSPANWIGAGSIASTLLRENAIDPHHRYDDDIASDHVAREEVKGAYYGGRVELLRQGVYRHVAAADLKSAYPTAATELPSLRGARLRKRKRFDPSKHGIWRVRWDLRGESKPGRGEDAILAPFPVRYRDQIFYPLAGEGFYHGVEVAAAIELGYPVEVKYGWILYGKHVAERPFDWIPTVFRERAKFAAEGHAAEKMIKLGLNSVYGKLAQGKGWFGEKPPYQSYFWAGYITARTRAAVLRMAVRTRDPMMIATDGIYAAELPPSGFGRRGSLGSWDTGEVDRLFAAQAGVYEAASGGKVVAKSRGFFASEVNYREVRHGWEAEGVDYVHHYMSTRFYGLGVALQRSDFSVWRKWLTEPRSILLLPERKLAQADGSLLPFPGFLESEPYRSRDSIPEDKLLEKLFSDDQPMRVDP